MSTWQWVVGGIVLVIGLPAAFLSYFIGYSFGYEAGKREGWAKCRRFLAQHPEKGGRQ